MVVAEEPATAEMNPWLVVDVNGELSLFGFAQRHPNTGGLSWVLSTEIVELEEAAGRARTASGRVYKLGRRIEPTELDEEGSLALRLLLAKWTGLETPLDNQDLRWLTARKMARHLGVEPPPRVPAAVELFVQTYHERYLALRDGRKPN